MPITNRTGKTKRTQNGCPYCSGRYSSVKNSLAFNFPKVAEEFSLSLNGGKTPEEFTPYSNKKVWWNCLKGHPPFETRISSRTKQGTGCPVCFGRKVIVETSLAYLFPKVVGYWDWEKNVDYHPERIGGGSHIKLAWKCQSGHEWVNTVKDLVFRHKRFPELEICLECRKTKRC